jgi:hypothetical protein
VAIGQSFLALVADAQEELLYAETYLLSTIVDYNISIVEKEAKIAADLAS